MSAPGPFGIYVHWPFCKAKCPYCDFNSHVARGAVDTDAYAAALAHDLGAARAITGPRKVTSVFFGGGTPSLMPPAAVERVLKAADELWGLPAEAEISLEANPTSVEAENFRGYRAAGVNRVSVGVQALDDGDLARLGRQHSVEEALAAFRLAANIFPRVSFDLIYARPGQTPESWRGELSRALAEQQGHMSLYQLTIEPGTAYFDLYAKGKIVTPPDEDAAHLYDITQELTAAAGLAAYEVSNHAAAGHESQHNLVYWRYGDYAGAGPGAHARLTDAAGRRLALANERDPAHWLARISRAESALTEEQELSPAEQGLEFLLMGMRLADGIDPARYAAITGTVLDAGAVTALAAEGLIAQDPVSKRIAATLAGRRVLNSVIARLALG